MLTIQRVAGAAALFSAVSTVPAQTPEPVSFATEDGGKIHANRYGAADHGVVLAHGAVFNKESWDAQAKRLAAEGFEVLAIDFRGYGKSSAGSQGAALALDVLAAVRFLRSQGAKQVSVIGGSMGGAAAAEAAARAKPGEIDKLILLAAGSVPNPAKLNAEVLFIVSEGDGARRAVERHYPRAPEPKELVILPGSAHAQHIFKTDQAEALLGHMIRWLKR